MNLYWNRKSKIYQQLNVAEYEYIVSTMKKIGLKCSITEVKFAEKHPPGILMLMTNALSENLH